MLSKKLLMGISLGAMAVGMAAPASAQTYTGHSETNTTGVNNRADPQSPTTTQGNESYITIVGDDNTATVRQTGDFNTSTITQNGDANDAQHFQRSGGDNNVATTDQNADGGFSNIDQDGGDANVALATQSGDDAVSDIEQDGSANRTTVTQNGLANDSFAYVGGNDVGGSVRSNVTVNQDGDNVASIVMVRDDIVGANGTPAGATDNTVTVNQAGDDTFSYVLVDGDLNSAAVTLNGQGDVEARQLNSTGYVNNVTGESVVWQLGNGNTASLVQDADNAHSDIYQGTYEEGAAPGLVYIPGSNRNVATVAQGAAGDLSLSGVYQGGSDNTATVSQNSSSSTSDARQYGDENVLNVAQSGGTANVSTVFQGIDPANTNAAGVRSVAGFGNSADVSQNGRNLRSEVYQGNSSANVFENSATVRQLGSYNSSIIEQRTNGNVAEANLAGGGVGSNGAGAGEQNLSHIVQTGPGTVDDNNSALAALNGKGNRSLIQQFGTQNIAENNIGAGGYNANAVDNVNPANLSGVGSTGMTSAPGSAYFTTAQAARPGAARFTGAFDEYEGNRSAITQNGDELKAIYKSADGGINAQGQATAAAGFRGKGNQSFVNQGTDSSNTGLQAARDHLAEVWQRGVLELSTINQRDGAGNVDQNGNTVRTYAATTLNQRSDTREGTFGLDGLTARSVASVSTNGDLSTVYVDQTGDNNAEVTIGGGEVPANQDFDATNTAVITQVDAGDFIVPPTSGGTTVRDPFNPFDNNPNAGTPGSVVRQWNDARILMSGDFGFAQVHQNARDARATVWQQAGSRNNGASVQQGRGLSGSAVSNTLGAGGDSTADTANPGTANFEAGLGGAATINVTADIVQRGSNNDAFIAQDGANLTATVTQLGNGGGGTGGQFQSGGLRNAVVISQTGGSNSATAIQLAGVRPSVAGDPASGNPAATNDDPTQDDEFYFAGGARSAEIRILQESTDNTAYASQAGAGQRARIEQSGMNNNARITQGADATNATAVIRQLGNGNSWQINQALAGQYQVVTQKGNGNTSIDGAGPNGGSSPIIP